MDGVLLPNFIQVGHAASVVHAAKNTIRMAALSGRIGYKMLPWGMVVNTKDLAHCYVCRADYHRNASGQVVYLPLEKKGF